MPSPLASKSSQEDPELALSFDLFPGEGIQLNFSYSDCQKVRALSSIFANLDPKRASEVFTSLSDARGSTGSAPSSLNNSMTRTSVASNGKKAAINASGGSLALTKSAFDASVRRLAPQAAKRTESERLYLSEALATIFSRYHEASSAQHTSSAAASGTTTTTSSKKTAPTVPNVSAVDLRDLSAGFSLLCKGSKSDKLQFIWETFDTDEDGFLTFKQLWGMIKSILTMFFALSEASSRHASGSLNEWIDDVAAEAAQVFFAESTQEDEDNNNNANAQEKNSSAKRRQRISFKDFGDVYNAGGYLVLPVLELLDCRKWPTGQGSTTKASTATQEASLPKVTSSPTKSAASVPAVKIASPPKGPPPSSAEAMRAAVASPAVQPPRIVTHTTTASTSATNANVEEDDEEEEEDEDDEEDEEEEEEEDYDEEEEEEEGPAPTSRLLLTFPLVNHVDLQSPGKSAASRIADNLYLRVYEADAQLYRRFLTVSGLELSEPREVLHAVLDASENGLANVHTEGLLRAIARLLAAAQNNKNSQNGESVQAYGSISAPDMRLLVCSLTNIHETLSVPEFADSVDESGNVNFDARKDPSSDVLDTVIALLPFAAGRKSEKLQWAWRLLDIDDVGGLTRRDVWRALRSFLISMLVMTRSRFIPAAETRVPGCPEMYVPEPVSAAEAAAIHAAADYAAVEGTSTIFVGTSEARDGREYVTIGELGDWYNSNGYQEIPWLELLDGRKWNIGSSATTTSAAATSSSSASKSQSQSQRQNVQVETAPADVTENDVNNTENDQEEEEAEEQQQQQEEEESPSQGETNSDFQSSFDDISIMTVSGARVVYEFGSIDPVDTSPMLRFTSIACDFVCHVSQVSGLCDLSAADVSRTIKATAAAKYQKHHFKSGASPSPFMLDRGSFNSCVRALIPVDRLTVDDRSHLSRFMTKLFSALDLLSNKTVDWRDMAVALSIFAGIGSKSDKIAHGFDLYTDSYARQDAQYIPDASADSSVNRIGLYCYLRALFASFSLIQECSAELDLAVSILVSESESKQQGAGNYAENNNSGEGVRLTSALEEVMRLPRSVRVSLRPHTQRTKDTSFIANHFVKCIFEGISEARGEESDYTRSVPFEALASFYNDKGGNSIMAFFELLSIAKWEKSASQLPTRDMRSVLTFAASRPLPLMAQAREAALDVAEIEEEEGDEEDDEGEEQGGEIEEEAGVDDGGVDGDAEDEDALLRTSVFQFTLPLVNADGSLGSHQFSLSAGDCISLKRVLSASHLDVLDPDDILMLIRSVMSSDEGVVKRNEFSTFLSKMLTAPSGLSSEQAVAEMQWSEAALQSVFTACDRQGNGSAPFADLACALIVFTHGSKSLKLQSGWQLFDSQNKGTLEAQELYYLLRAFLTPIYVIKSWGKLGENATPQLNMEGVLSHSDQDAIMKSTIALADAVLEGSLTQQERKRPKAGVSFQAFGTFYNALHSLVAERSSANRDSNEAAENAALEEFLEEMQLDATAFMWLELLDMRKIPNFPQSSSTFAAISSRNKGGNNNNSSTARVPPARSVVAPSLPPPPPPPPSSRPEARGYSQLPSSGDDEDDDDEDGELVEENGESEDDENHAAAIYPSRVIYNLELTTAGNMLEVTDVDLISVQRIASVSPLSRLEPSALVEILAPHVAEGGLLKRRSFELIVRGFVDAGLNAVTQAVETAEVNETNENDMDSLFYLARSAMRDCERLGYKMMRIFDLLPRVSKSTSADQNNDNDEVDVLELIPALFVLAKGSKSKKLLTAWQLCTGAQPGGRLDQDSFASFLASILIGIYGLTSAGDELEAEVLRSICARSAMEATEVVFNSQLNEYEADGESSARAFGSNSSIRRQMTISYEDFVNFYNGGTGSKENAPLASSGFLVTPYLELLSSNKWELPKMLNVSAQRTKEEEEDDNEDEDYNPEEEEEEEDEDDDEEENNEQANAELEQELADLKEEARLADEREQEDLQRKQQQEEEEEEEQEEEDYDDDNDDEKEVEKEDKAVYGFILMSDQTRLTLTHSDMNFFSAFVRASGLHRLSCDYLMRSLLEHASRGNAIHKNRPVLSRTDFEKGLTDIQESAVALRFRAGSLGGDEDDSEECREQGLRELNEDLHVVKEVSDRLFDAFKDRRTQCANAFELAAGLSLLSGGGGKKSEKLLAGWQLFSEACYDSTPEHINKPSPDALALDREHFVSFLRSVLLALSTFAHMELRGSDALKATNEGAGVLYRIATAAADEIADKVFDVDESGFSLRFVTLDEFAGYYNGRNGWETCGFLELLDLDKWGEAAIAQHQRNFAATYSADEDENDEEDEDDEDYSPDQEDEDDDDDEDEYEDKEAQNAELRAELEELQNEAAGRQLSYDDEEEEEEEEEEEVRVKNAPYDASYTLSSAATAELQHQQQYKQQQQQQQDDADDAADASSASNSADDVPDEGRFHFDLPRNHPLIIAASDIEMLGLIRTSSGFDQLSPMDFVSKLSRACFPTAPATAASDGSATELYLPVGSDASALVTAEAFKSALRALIPVSRLTESSRTFLSKNLMRLFYQFEEYRVLIESSSNNNNTSAEGSRVSGVPFCELATALLFTTAGSKTDKLLAAFCAFSGSSLPEGLNQQLSQQPNLSFLQFAALLRSLLVGLITFRSNRHIQNETEDEEKTLDALVTISLDLAQTAFEEKQSTSGDDAILSFVDFGIYYNKGGYSQIPFVELLAWKKASSSS